MTAETKPGGLDRLRGAPERVPDASIVVPVNARTDLESVLRILGDLSTYRGARAVEVVLVVNNFSPEEPPRQIESLRALGARVLSIPRIWKPGEVVAFTARVPGIREAGSETVVLFDADCRIPDPTALLDWYIERFEAGSQLAYTFVGYFDLPHRPLARLRIGLHHLARWVKRVVARIPTPRGSNYAVQRSLFLEFYDKGMLAEDMNVGPVFKAAGASIAYSRKRGLSVITSGRGMTGKSLTRMVRYFWYRLVYNLRVLRVRRNAAAFTGRTTRPAAVLRTSVGERSGRNRRSPSRSLDSPPSSPKWRNWQTR